VKWRDIERLGFEYLRKHPYSDVIWYPSGSFKSNRVINNLSILAFHIAPALVLDTVARLTGKKPM
jgi:alcohol-forming fatty acyl-CoA reductase